MDLKRCCTRHRPDSLGHGRGLRCWTHRPFLSLPGVFQAAEGPVPGPLPVASHPGLISCILRGCSVCWYWRPLGGRVACPISGTGHCQHTRPTRPASWKLPLLDGGPPAPPVCLARGLTPGKRGLGLGVTNWLNARKGDQAHRTWQENPARCTGAVGSCGQHLTLPCWGLQVPPQPVGPSHRTPGFRGNTRSWGISIHLE